MNIRDYPNSTLGYKIKNIFFIVDIHFTVTVGSSMMTPTSTLK